MNTRFTIMAVAVSLLLSACSEPPPLVLVTDEEAGQPSSRGGFTLQEKGPNIEIHLPNSLDLIASSFPIYIEFSEGSEASTVNMASLKLTYKKLWGIDITDRVIDYISGTTISVPETELPAGRHTIEIYIEDSKQNISTQQITVTVQ
ncbi:MAG: hypothetical protein QGH93_10240 [Gammaproteobacteria bacterium]|nr:hypothetical protein [Gammaproteobacteria bacterium]